MFMPPQQQSPTDPNYNFIFSEQKPKRGFKLSLPGSNNLVKLTLLIVAAAVVLGILIIALSSFFGPKVNTAQITEVVARAHEISRVSDLVVLTSTDQNTRNLAATTSNSLTSEQAQLLGYLGSLHKKITAKDLNIYLDKNVDKDIQNAVQNNNLTQDYTDYLKKHLPDYETSVKLAYNGTNLTKAKSILNEASISTTLILSTGPLASN
jgi:hypothetical protein